MSKITKEFTITTTKNVMKRFERFLAMIHHNSKFGHSGLFAMPVDGDGSDDITIVPKPEFAKEVNITGGIGGNVEIAQDDCYTVTDVKPLKSSWVVKNDCLFKNGETYK